MGLNVIVRRFQWVGSGGNDPVQNSDSTKTEYYLKVIIRGLLSNLEVLLTGILLKKNMVLLG